jgi:hypothetical protein
LLASPPSPSSGVRNRWPSSFSDASQKRCGGQCFGEALPRPPLRRSVPNLNAERFVTRLGFPSNDPGRRRLAEEDIRRGFARIQAKKAAVGRPLWGSCQPAPLTLAMGSASRKLLQSKELHRKSKVALPPATHRGVVCHLGSRPNFSPPPAPLLLPFAVSFVFIWAHRWLIAAFIAYGHPGGNLRRPEPVPSGFSLAAGGKRLVDLGPSGSKSWLPRPDCGRISETPHR